MSANFGLTTSTPAVNVIQSINYLLATQGQATGSNVNLGNVVQVSGNNAIYSSNAGIIGYVNGYVDVKYANSATGGSGFSSNSTMATYYGVYNSPTNSESSNPVNYQWYQVAGGFGTTKGLYYTTGGGNSISFQVGSTAPNQYYQPVPDNTPIVLASISANLVVANSLANSSVTTNAIAQAAVTGYNIAANTITANNIQVGSLTANLFVANTVFVNTSLQSSNATFNSFTSPGFWLNATDGNVRFGGNTSIGNNLSVGANAAIGGNLIVGNNAVIGGNASVAGIITTGALNANVVTTSSLVQTAATQVISNSNNTGLELINWVNGNATVGGTGYLWPLYTRGFALGGGTTITTTTNGSATGSQIQVTYNTYLNSATNPTYNLVELWRTGSSVYYKNTFNIVRSQYGQVLGPTTNNEYFAIPGNNGALYVGNIGNISSVITNTTNNLYDAFYDPSSSSLCAWGTTGQFNEFTYQPGTAPTENYNGNVSGVTGFSGSNTLPLFNIYGAEQLYYTTSPRTYLPTIVVGSSGYIAFATGLADIYFSGSWTFETSGVFADLNDVCADIEANSYTSGSTVNYVSVGTAGTILYNSRTFDTGGNIASTSGWSQATSGTINNLNSVQSNYGLTTRANTWVAVGNSGTILHSGSPSGPWLPANSVPVTTNINAVGYTNGTWVAVGDSGVIITSTDGSNWTGPIANPADGVTVPANGLRNLYGVAGGLETGLFVAAGQEIILTSNTANPTTGGWNSNAYLGGSSLNSTLTRVQFQGSWANVANVSQPPSTQQITNGQVLSGLYTDINYTAGQNITYYLVAGNMYGNVNVYVNGPNLTITEIKR